MGTLVQNFVFDDDQPHGLRVVMRGDEPWFVAKDVCAVLDIEQAARAVEPLDDDEKAAVSLTHTSSNGVEQGRETLIVSEGGLYTLILRSRQATSPGSMAHRFRKWVTGELLPQLRRTGRYAPAPGDGFDWDMITAKIHLVREARLTMGRKAAAGLWQSLGLPALDAAVATRPAGARQGVDIVQQFLAECTVEDPRGHVQARALSTRFAEWARANDAPAMTERALAICLEALGIEKHRGRLYCYLGLRLVPHSARLG